MTDPRMPTEEIQDLAAYRCVKQIQHEIRIIREQVSQLDNGLQTLLVQLKEEANQKCYKHTGTTQ